MNGQLVATCGQICWKTLFFFNLFLLGRTVLVAVMGPGAGRRGAAWGWVLERSRELFQKSRLGAEGGHLGGQCLHGAGQRGGQRVAQRPRGWWLAARSPAARGVHEGLVLGVPVGVPEPLPCER